MKRFVLGFIVIVSLFVGLISHTARLQRSHGLQLLEDGLRRSAAACYACEGFYPANIAYLQQHYGFTYDESRYQIHYQLIAANWMPDITVMEIQP